MTGIHDTLNPLTTSTPAPRSSCHGLQAAYLYDADGNRIAKGTIELVNNQLSCDTTQNNFQITTSYVLDPNNQQLTEMSWSSGTPQWARTHVWVAGQLAATYNVDPNTSDNQPGILYFHLADWLGTLRLLTDYAGNAEQACHSLPYGNGEDCAPTHSAHLFTGKERDTESGNDYFGARYYASSMGRFMSPDPSGLYYADPSNPQSLNLYAYALNNPLKFIDPSGLTICDYGQNDDGSEDYEEADNPDECTSNDGTVVVAEQSVTVTADTDDSSNDSDDSWDYSFQWIEYPNSTPNGGQPGAPNTGTKTLQLLKCASKTANQFSIAGFMGITGENSGVAGAIGTAFLGNTFSGLVDTGTHIATGNFGAAYGDFALGGTAQGLPFGTSVSAKGVVGVTTDAAVGATLGAEMVEPVGWAKLAIDGLVFGGSVLSCLGN